MANRIANLLGNTKTRTLVLLVIGILIFGVVIAVSQSDSGTKEATRAASKTTEVPNQVQSTPGEQVSRKYRELQEQANIRGAKEAAEKGTTFIPTLTGSSEGYNDADFDKQLSTAFDDLGGKCSKETVANLRKQGMDNTQIIMELKSFGCSAAAIASLFSSDQIAAALLAAQECDADVAGCNADSAKKLKAMGYDANKIAATFKSNGCKVNDMAAALKANGSTNEEIAVALKSTGASVDEIAVALKANGASADEIAVALKATGSEASQIAAALSKAGFSNLEVLAALNKSGFSPVEIARAMSALDLQGADSAALLAQQRAAQLAAQQESQQLAAYSQQRQQKIQELMSAMEAQKSQAMATWNDIPQQVLVQGEWAATVKGPVVDANGAVTYGANSGTAAAAPPEVILKSGSILFAVLDTAVNSDEKGPILATIVSGPLKGSRLTGTMVVQSNDESLALNFTSINMPNESKSMGISAVAIDPDTARTALAGDVDHHYLMRWGSLFASSFIQGYASAVASAGQTSTTSQGAAGTVTTTTTPALDGRQQLFEGLAEVATKWSEVVAKNFDTPNTITIDQGTGIGVLVTADLTYGTDPVYYSTTPTPTTAPATASSLAAVNTGLSNEQTAALLGAVANLQQKPTTTTSTGGNK